MPYLWVTIGSALGGLLRYSITQLTLPFSAGIPYGTILINLLGSFLIGYVGGRYPTSDVNLRLFLMVGICGGFTTFSSFSLQTFSLLQSGLWGKALANIVLSVVLCLAAVVAGHGIAMHAVARAAIDEASGQEYTG
jgi:fluoride exporter